MFSLLLAVICVGFVAGQVKTPPLENGGRHWALLVAGSQGYYNYRHQADVCHAYHVMRDHGIPEENIIVMMYDDVAHSPENPTPGVLINRPNGSDVYGGVKIDYKGKHVTPKNFLSVLQGNKKDMLDKGTGRVLESGKHDHIFVNFVDHGAPGLVAFPTQELHARPLLNALKQMHAEKKFAQMVFYLESCESGSMFSKLPDNINIYATTAANGHESSYACYYDKKRKTYLGDLYSVNWMENSDVSNLNTETLASQFADVKMKTNRSHAQEYGDLSIAKEPVGDFQGNVPSARNVYYPEIVVDTAESENVGLYILQHQLTDAQETEEKDLLSQLIEDELMYRDSITVQMKNIVSFALNNDHRQVSQAMTVRTDELDLDCYEPAVKYYSSNCRRLSDNAYALRVLYAIQNVCNVEGMRVDTLVSAMDKVCI